VNYYGVVTILNSTKFSVLVVNTDIFWNCS